MIWLTPPEIKALPATGAAYGRVKAAADSSLSNLTGAIGDQDNQVTVNMYACALLAVRVGGSYVGKVEDALKRLPGAATGGNGYALGPARNVLAAILAADVVGYRAAAFETWAKGLPRKVWKDSDTLVNVHEGRPNNWGTHAGASRLAVALYVGDATDLARAAKVFKGWLGDRAAYSGFDYGALHWQADPSKPVGVNPKGATKNFRSIDGALPEELRRSGGFSWPPPKQNYCYEALQGAVVQAELLRRNGYPDVLEWSDAALLRAYRWLYEQADFPAEGDDLWQPWLLRYLYGQRAGFLPTTLPAARSGKNLGFTDWTHTGQSPALPKDCTAQQAAVITAKGKLDQAKAAVTAAEADLAAAHKALADCEG